MPQEDTGASPQARAEAFVRRYADLSRLPRRLDLCDHCSLPINLERTPTCKRRACVTRRVIRFLVCAPIYAWLMIGLGESLSWHPASTAGCILLGLAGMIRRFASHRDPSWRFAGRPDREGPKRPPP